MMTDCHMVPQFVYAESIHHVFCRNSQLKSFLSERGYQLDKLKDSIGNQYVPTKWLEDDVIELINTVYRKDFDLCDDFVMITR